MTPGDTVRLRTAGPLRLGVVVEIVTEDCGVRVDGTPRREHSVSVRWDGDLFPRTENPDAVEIVRR